MASFKKPIENISSQEELLSVLTKALKLQVPVIFDMPFMTKEEYKKLSANPSFRFAPNFKYSDYYVNTDKGVLSRIDKKTFIIINPENNLYMTDSRLTISELYHELVHSDDFQMYIDGNQISFMTDTGDSQTLKKKVDEVGSLESFVSLIKKLVKTRSNRVDFEIPFLRKEYADDLKSMDSYNRIRSQMDDNFKSKYEEISDGKLSNIILNKYVFITPNDNNLLPDSHLTFNELYNSLKNDGEDYRMYIDGKDVLFVDNNTNEGRNMIKFKSKLKEDDNQSPIDVARRMGYDAAKEGDKNKYDASLRSLMNNHPGDKQREDIHKAFIAGMDSFKSNESIKEDNEINVADKAKELYHREQINQAKGLIDRLISKKTPEATQKIKALLPAIEQGYEALGLPDAYKNYIDGLKGYVDRSIFEGKDLGKPGKNFDKIASKAAKKYGSKEAGDKVAGAVLADLRKEHPKKYSEAVTEEGGEQKESPVKDDTKKKYVIELSFNYDGDSTLADKIQDQLGKQAEVNEVLRTRRIMEFDFKNQAMFNAAMETIKNTMKECGKADYKLDSRIDDDVAPEVNPEEVALKEDICLMIESNRYPLTVTLPLIIESMKWASKNRSTEYEILKFANNLVESNVNGIVLDI